MSTRPVVAVVPVVALPNDGLVRAYEPVTRNSHHSHHSHHSAPASRGCGSLTSPAKARCRLCAAPALEAKAPPVGPSTSPAAGRLLGAEGLVGWRFPEGDPRACRPATYSVGRSLGLRGREWAPVAVLALTFGGIRSAARGGSDGARV